MFDSSCAYAATERGCAVVFPIEHHPHSSSNSHQVSGGGPEEEGEEKGKDKADSEGGADSGGELALFEIDLNEER